MRHRDRVVAVAAACLLGVGVVPGAGVAGAVGPAVPGDRAGDEAGRVYFYEGIRGKIWSAEPDGTDPRRVIRAFRATDPAVSPNGRWIAYMLEFGRIEAAPVAHPRRTRTVGSSLSTGFTQTGSWSPDNQQFVWARLVEVEWRTYRSDLYVFDRRTNASRLIASTPDVQEMHPRFSPDGSEVLYEAESGRGCSHSSSQERWSDLYTIDLATLEVTLLTHQADADWSVADWKGDLLLASRIRRPGATGEIAEPCPEGTESKIVTMTGAGRDVTQRGEGVGLALSPDGSSYAFHASGAVFTKPFDGDEATLIFWPSEHADWAVDPPR